MRKKQQHKGNTNEKITIIAVLLFTCSAFAKEAELYAKLGSEFNSPASSTQDKNKNIYFTSPNFHNQSLIKNGHIKKPKPPVIGIIDTKGNIKFGTRLRKKQHQWA